MAVNPWGMYRDPFNSMRQMMYDLERPVRVFDQYFGMPLTGEDILPLATTPYIRPLMQLDKSKSGMAEVQLDKDKFQVSLDVQHFKPEELSVKTTDKFIIIEGKHEERPDEQGFVYRHFSRRYALPEGVKPDSVKSSLSPDGVLTITAPRLAIEGPKENERIIPIQQSTQPALKQ